MSLGHGASTVRSGLIAHWDAANIKSYNSVTSTSTWFDLSGNSINATLLLGASYVNSSIYFNGVDNYASFTTLSFPDSNPYTVMAVIRLETGTTIDSLDRRTVLGNSSDGGSIGFQSRSTTTTITGNLTVWNSASIGPNIPCDKNEGDIFCITVTRDSANTLKGYVDSRLTTTTISTGTMNFNELGRRAGGFRHFYGNIYDLKIYDRALSETEVHQNFEALRGRYGI